MVFLNKVLMFFILLSLPFNFCYTGVEINFCNDLDQQNLNIDQIQQALREYAIASKKYVNNPLGWSALNYAIEVKDFKSALILAMYCKNINQRNPLYKGSNEYINALERIFYREATLSNQNSNKSLSEAEIQLTYILLDRGIQVSKGFFSPIAGACWLNIDDLIIRFIELGADVNCRSGTPLYYLIENGNLNMARYLINNGANLKAGRVLFQAAINSQKIESIDFLISLGLVLEGIKQMDYVIHAFSFLKREIKSIDECSNQSFSAFEVFCRILELGADPNFWIHTEGLNPKNYEQVLNRCPLWLALELPSQTSSQYLYKNSVIQVLLDYGAIMP